MTPAPDRQPSAPPAGRARPGSRSCRAAALVIVLLLFAIISIILSEFLYSLRVQNTLVKNHEGKVTAGYVAQGGQNAADGLLRHASPEDERLFNNELIQLFRYQCLSPAALPALGLTSDQEQQATDQAANFNANSGCGAWSLAIPYVLAEIPLDLEISDEQARLNLNALVRVLPGSTSETVFTTNNELYRAVFELFVFQAVKAGIELSDDDVRTMLNLLVDYMDYGMVEGSFDQDVLSYFEYENSDAIVPLKNGPLDTVDEIRYLPGMTDELFYAVKDFLTVYPTLANGQFSPQVNLNAAPVEVIYALIRATSYEREEPTLAVEEAYQLAVDMINEAYTGAAETGRTGTPTVPNAAALPRYQRKVPAQLNANSLLRSLTLQRSQLPRFYRVRSTALTDDGFESTITKVIVVSQSNTIDTLYYREE